MTDWSSDWVDEKVWWRVAKTCPYATFFHTPLWARLARLVNPRLEIAPVGAVDSSGVEVVLPVVRINKPLKGLFSNYDSTFAGCYGGTIATDEVPASVTQQLYDRVRGIRLGALRVTGNPIRQKGKLVAAGGTRTQDSTHILELTGDLESIIAGFSKGHKSSYSKGCRMGVTTRVAESLSDYKAYFGAYEDSLRRWGEDATSVYPWRLFKGGYHLSRAHPDHLKLWLAEVDAQVVAGAWVFYWNSHAVHWHGASYADFFDYSPNNVLQVAIIADALSRGFTYYDMNPSGGHEGVARFKGRFGAAEWPVERVVYHGSLYLGLTHLKRKIYRG